MIVNPLCFFQADRDMSGVHTGPEDGNWETKPTQGIFSGTEAGLRDGRLLRPLQPPADPPDAHPKDRSHRVVQVQVPQHGEVVRQETPGARSQRRNHVADEEDPAGLRRQPHRRARAGLRRAQSLLDLRLLVHSGLQGKTRGQVPLLPGQLPGQIREEYLQGLRGRGNW